MRRIGIIAATLALFFVLGIAAANAGGVDLIWVDGNPYEATKQSGPTLHFETPDTNPQAAYTERNVWQGNGSENLPCPGGIHWIDNKNVLTISNCLTAPETTTTPVPETTTTTLPNLTTTTTTPSTTTSTLPGSTTTTVFRNCCLDPTCETVPTMCLPTTTVPTTVPCDQTDPATCLPVTGPTGLRLIGLLGVMFVVLGAAAVRYARRR